MQEADASYLPKNRDNFRCKKSPIATYSFFSVDLAIRAFNFIKNILN